METSAQNAKPEGATKDAASQPRITYTSRSDATPEGELCALAAIYALVIRAHEKKAAASIDDDGKEVNTQRRRSGQSQ